MAKLYFKIKADREEVQRLQSEIQKLKATLATIDAQKEPTIVKQLTEQIKASIEQMRGYISTAPKAVKTTQDLAHIGDSAGISIAKAFSILGEDISVKSFISKMISVRGEFQAMENTLRTLVKSKQEADTLLSEIKEYAKVSPLDLKGVSTAAQTMIGFNIEAGKVPAYIRAIGDVSMGDAQRFQSLTLAFSQMSATGMLMEQDLNQMINAGFNPLSVMAEKSAQSISQLKEEMSKGAISAQMVQQAFIDATSAGGNFYGMNQNASKTINGQLAKLQDAIDAVFNDIGTKSEGIVLSSISATSTLIENYDKIGKLLVGMIATYGIYRTAVIANIALTRGWTTAARADAIAKELQTIATKAQTIAQIALNSAMRANPYILLGTAVAGLVATMWALHDSTKGARAEQERLNTRAEEQAEAARKEKEDIDRLLSTIQDETETRENKFTALRRLQQLYPSVFDKYRTEEELLADLTKAQIALNKARTDGQTALQNANYAEDRKRYEDFVKVKNIFSLIGKYKATSKDKEGLEKIRSLYKELEIIRSRYKGERLGIDNIDQLISQARATVGANQANQRKQQAINFDLSLQSFTKEQAQKELARMEELRKQLRKENKSWIKIEGEEAPIDEAEIRRREEALRAYIAIERKDAKTYREEARKEWLKAKEEVEAIKNGKQTYTSSTAYASALKKAQENEKSLRSRYESLGGEVQSSVSSTNNTTTKEGRNLYEEEKEAKLYAKELKTAHTRLQNEARESIIALKEDGPEKELAQIRLDYDRKKDEIEQKEVELLQSQQDAEYKRWKEENPNGGDFKPTITALDTETAGYISTLYTQAEKELYKRTEEVQNKLLDKYKSFSERKKEVEETYNKDITEIEKLRTTDNAQQIDARIAEAERQKKKAIESIASEEAEATTTDSDFFRRLFSDVADMSYSGIVTLKKEAQALMDYFSGKIGAEGITFLSPSQLKAIENAPEKLSAIKKELKSTLSTSSYGDSPLGTAINKIEAGIRKLKDPKADPAVAIRNIAEGSSAATKEIGRMFSALGNDNIAETIEGLTEIADGVSKIAKGFETGGVPGGIMAGVDVLTSMIGKMGEAQKRHREAINRVMQDSISQQRAYNLLLIEQDLLMERATTIFGTDTYLRATNAINVARKAVEALNKELKGDGEYKGFAETFIEKLLFSSTHRKEDVKDKYAGLANIGIVTGHNKTGLFGWGKGKDTYSSILDVYKDLIDANGNLNIELAKTIISTRKMKDEHKNALQHMIDLAEQEKKAIAEMNGFLSNIFGGLGNELMDALVSAFRNGKDAAKDFTDVVSSMLENLGKQMIYSVTIAPLMEKAQEEMKAIMQNTNLSDEAKFRQWTAILSSLMNDAIDQQAIANKMMDEYARIAEEKGLHLFKKDKETQSGSTRGVSTMTQDQAMELNGRFTALQVAGEGILQESITTNDYLQRIHSTITSPSVEDVAERGASLIRDTYKPGVNIHFPTESINALIGEVAILKQTLLSMERTQAEARIDQETITEHTRAMVKHQPRMIKALESIETNTK